MSSPAIPTELDDGLLTASEIARFELNADWVILSACNTAGGERPEAEALSGLARSFSMPVPDPCLFRIGRSFRRRQSS